MAVEQKFVPDKFKFQLLSIPGLPNEYKLGKHGDILCWSDTLASIENCTKHNELVVLCRPSDEDWLEFAKVLRELAAGSWKRNYHNEEILDGTRWGLVYKDTSLNIKSSGINSYPKGFKRVKKAIEKLLKIDFNH